MRNLRVPLLAAASACVALAALTGCAHPSANSDAAAATTAPPPAVPVAVDSRIPAARRAQIEQTIAQQQAGLSQTEEKLKAAAAAQHH